MAALVGVVPTADTCLKRFVGVTRGKRRVAPKHIHPARICDKEGDTIAWLKRKCFEYPGFTSWAIYVVGHVHEIMRGPDVRAQFKAVMGQ